MSRVVLLVLVALFLLVSTTGCTSLLWRSAAHAVHHDCGSEAAAVIAAAAILTPFALLFDAVFWLPLDEALDDDGDC